VQLTLLAVGKLRPALRQAADEYLKRLRRYAQVSELEVKEAGKAPNAEVGRRIEGAHLRERVPEGARVIVLDRSGRGWSSEDLARRLDAWRLASDPVALVLGGAHGLDPALLVQADEQWSLGPLTLPHQLARVVVMEQLYRAWTILRGEPYHK
jgi:23S rRNA (pseudouridine1915-N3)-methyltransferase